MLLSGIGANIDVDATGSAAAAAAAATYVGVVGGRGTCRSAE
jgi:hypothetical protein